MKFGSLFTGIGALDLGLERAGMECRWQVESDAYCQRVLAKRWPGIVRYGDIRLLDTGELERVDLIAGGFPCQDLSASQTGERLGLDGARSGLWKEFARVLRGLRPRFALIENSPMLLNRGLDRILCDLAALGYDAEWSTLSACALGASHTRERLFVLAYATSNGRNGRWLCEGSQPKTTGHSATVWQPSTGPVKRLLEAEDWRTYCVRGGRRADGASSKLDRLRGTGNAVPVFVGEWLGERITEFYLEERGF